MVGSFGTDVIDGVDHDVFDVVVGDGVDGFSASLLALEEIGVAQDAEVL